METENEYDQTEHGYVRTENEYSQSEDNYTSPEKDFTRKENDYIRLPVNNDEEQPQKPQRRSLWRHWKMLSRFQRNLITMVFVAVVVTVVYYWGLKEQVKLEEQKSDLMNPQIHQPQPQRADLEELKPMGDWEKEREDDENRLKNEKRLIEEAKKRQEEQKDEKIVDLKTKKSDMEKKRLDMKRRMDLKERQEKEQQEKALKDTARLEARLELRKKEADEIFADEWFEIQKQKQEMKREDERLIREEQERLLFGEVTTEESYLDLEPTTTLSPEELEKVCQ